MLSPLALTDLAHAAQLKAVHRAQDLAVVSATRLTQLRAAVPAVPDPVGRLTRPVSAHLVAYRRDWLDVATSFTERLAKVTKDGSNDDQPIPRPTVVK